MKKNLYLLLALLLATGAASAQITPIQPSAAGVSDAAWEARYQNRLNELRQSYTYNGVNGNSNVDDGKKMWPRLISHMYDNRNNPSALNNIITGDGQNLLNSQWSGTICAPFSGPGYAAYYFEYKDQLTQAQKDTVYDYLYNPTTYPYRCPSGFDGWHFLMRPDQQMDPIYNLENPGITKIGTEKNSENYHWMMRMPGYLFSEEFDTTNAPASVQRRAFFTGFVNNWVRALYHSGRIEWNANNYWSHTFNPTMVLHNYAKDTAIKARAKAGLDWMMVETALHHIDGFHAGADVRAKPNAYEAFSGSIWGYNYLYYADDTAKPSYYVPNVFDNKEVYEYIGYAPHSDYRPPQVLIDIARRNFDTPVEIQSAKPFYAADWNEYENWKGDDSLSRRFEFETLWIDDNYLLSSAATHVPDGWFECDGQRPFSEESLWRLAVRGTTTAGPVQLYGNAGPVPYSWKNHVMREPKEQIGQYRNMMMRMIQGIDSMWVEAPRTIAPDISGTKVFMNLGSGVYAAFQSSNASGFDTLKSGDNDYRRYRWTYNTTTTGNLVLETGTQEDYGSFANFKTQINANATFTAPNANTISYTGANTYNIRMEYQDGPATYTMLTPITPACVIQDPGTTPKVWGDNNYIDYETWDSYRTVFGPNIVSQGWGDNGGTLELRSRDNGLQIKVDTAANVSYGTFDPMIYTSLSEKRAVDKAQLFDLFPNPVDGSEVMLAWHAGLLPQVVELTVTDLTGKTIYKQPNVLVVSGRQIQIPVSNWKQGIYIVAVQSQSQKQVRKLVVE